MDFKKFDEFEEKKALRFFGLFIEMLFQYKWKILISLMLSLIIAFLYVRYVPKVFLVSAQIMIEQNNNSVDPGNMLFGQGGLSVNRDLANEIILMKSYSLLEEAVKKVDYNVNYFRTTEALERVIEIETSESIFHINVIYPDTFPGVVNKAIPYKIRVESAESGFVLTRGEGESVALGQWGDTLSLNGIDFVLSSRIPPNGRFNSKVSYLFSISSVENCTRGLESSLSVSLVDESSSAILLSIAGQLTNKNKVFIDALLGTYLESNLAQKNQGASNTIKFINGELDAIKDSLSRIESRLKVFKSSNRISDLSKEGERIFERLIELEGERSNVQLQMKYVELVADYLEKGNNEGLIMPASFGISDPAIDEISESLVRLESELDRYEKASSNVTGIRTQLESRISRLKDELRSYIDNMKEVINIRLVDLNRRVQIIEQTIEGIPSSELALMNIQRLQKLSESLYLLLLEKRAEAEITKSSNTPDVKIIDSARLKSPKPIQPKSQIALALAVLIGLLFPCGSIFIVAYFDSRIRSKDDVLNGLDLPFMGGITHTIDASINYISEEPKSRLAESFRSLRSNLKYFGADKGIKVIMITSCFPGEGKTFVSANLTKSIGAAKKKVLLIGADLRKPQLQNYFSINQDKGLSSYLAGYSTMSEITNSIDDHVDLILSGPIPPNPVELLDSERYKTLISDARGLYDFVIIDTSPFVLVTDSRYVMDSADITLTVLRSGVSKSVNLELIGDLSSEFDQKSFGIVLNDIQTSSLSYGSYKMGYGKGYGYYSD
jgi:tyrosine-protein kinase Etk/Wzc